MQGMKKEMMSKMVKKEMKAGKPQKQAVAYGKVAKPVAKKKMK